MSAFNGFSSSNVVPQNSDDVDVFGFKKPSYDNKLVAAMPVPKEAMFYNMNHKNRGVAIIFNHEYFEMDKLKSRSGTQVDCDNLKCTLHSLGFDVTVHSDLTVSELMARIRRAAEHNHSDNDCFLVAVLTHGEMGILYAKDTAYKPESLWAPFTANKCLSLAGKPKLFFIQACQGDQLDPGVTLQKRTDVDGQVQLSYKIPVHADFLIAYSTIPGFYSWRNTTKGSWFMQALCLELQERSHQLDLLALLTMVSQRVAFDYESNTPADRVMHQQKQIPCITTMLTRLLRFEQKGQRMDTL